MAFELEACQSGVPDKAGSYEHSFGLLSDHTPYVNGLNGCYKSQDLRESLGEMAKVGMKSLATSTGGAGTAGYAMIPVYVSNRIVDVSRKYTPLTELIPRVTNQGITADYVRVTAKGAATTAAEDAAVVDQAHTRERVSKTIKYLYSVGKVTGPAIAAMPSYILEGFQASGSGLGGGNPFASVSASNALQQEVVLAARALKELEENLIINGNATTSVGSGPDGTEFDGIIQLQGSTNVTDLSGAALEYDNVEESIENAFVDGGRPSLGLASPRVVRRLRKIMLDAFRIPPGNVDIAFGIQSKIMLSTSVGDIPVIQSQYLTNTSGSARIYFLDMDWIEMRVLQDMTYEKLAHTNDSERFMLKMYECLIMRAPEFNAGIIGIE